ELETLDELVAASPVPLPALPAGEHVDRLAAGEVRPQVRVPGDVGEASMDRDRLPPGIHAQHLRAAGGRPQQSQQDADGGGLPGAVGAEEAGDLTGGNRQGEAVQGTGGAEGL